MMKVSSCLDDKTYTMCTVKQRNSGWLQTMVLKGLVGRKIPAQSKINEERKFVKSGRSSVTV